MQHNPKKSLKTWGDVNGALEALGELGARRDALECQLRPEIDRLTADLLSETEPIDAQIEAIEKQVRDFVTWHLDDFGGAKTKNLAAGSVSIRKATRVDIKDEAEAVDALLEMGLTNCVQVTYKPVKAAIKNLGKGDLICIGASICDDIKVTLKPLIPKA